MKNEIDEVTKKLLGDPHYDPYLTKTEKDELLRKSVDLAKHLMRLHGMQPPNKKIFVKKPFAGRGEFDVLATLNSTLTAGSYQLMERRKQFAKPDRPRVAMLYDTSASMANRGIVKSSMLLCLSFIEFFGNGWAKDFSISYIGNYSDTAPIFQKANPESAKRFIVDSALDEYGTNFMPAFNSLEQFHFYEGVDTKFIFIITDGFPEKYIRSTNSISSQTVQRDYDAEPDMVKKMIIYMKERWEYRKEIIFFWIQIGNPKKMAITPSIYDLLQEFSYCPPENEFNVEYDVDNKGYKAFKGRNDPKSSHYPLGEYYWHLFKKKAFFYTTINELGSGVGIHNLLNFLVARFESVFN